MEHNFQSIMWYIALRGKRERERIKNFGNWISLWFDGHSVVNEMKSIFYSQSEFITLSSMDCSLLLFALPPHFQSKKIKKWTIFFTDIVVRIDFSPCLAIKQFNAICLTTSTAIISDGSLIFLSFFFSPSKKLSIFFNCGEQR